MRSIILLMGVLIYVSTDAWGIDYQCEVFEIEEYPQYGQMNAFEKVKNCSNESGEVVSRSLLSPIRATNKGNCAYKSKGVVIRDDEEEIMDSVEWFSRPTDSGECPDYGDEYLAVDNTFEKGEREQNFIMVNEFLDKSPMSSKGSELERFSIFEKIFCGDCKAVENYLEDNSLITQNIVAFKNYQCVHGESEGNLCLRVVFGGEFYDLDMESVDGSLYIKNAKHLDSREFIIE